LASNPVSSLNSRRALSTKSDYRERRGCHDPSGLSYAEVPRATLG
jgi:hypothetical protein